MKLKILVEDLEDYEIKIIRHIVREISSGFLGISIAIRKHESNLIVSGFYYESETTTLMAVLKDVYKLIHAPFSFEIVENDE